VRQTIRVQESVFESPVFDASREVFEIIQCYICGLFEYTPEKPASVFTLTQELRQFRGLSILLPFLVHPFPLRAPAQPHQREPKPSPAPERVQHLSLPEASAQP
jgi:hypothetical protein